MAHSKFSLAAIAEVYDLTGGSQNATAKHFGLNRKSIYYRLKRAGIILDRKRLPVTIVDGITFTRDALGYMRATKKRDREDTTKSRRHRFIASKRGDDVVGNHVHHENQNREDDEPENLTTMSPSAHTRHHKVKQDGHALS